MTENEEKRLQKLREKVSQMKAQEQATLMTYRRANL